MASSAAQMQTAFNVTTWDGLIPLYETGEEVYIRTEYNVAAQSSFTQNPYTLVNNLVSKTNGSGIPLDAAGASAAGVTAADISTVGAGNDTAAEWPIFYQVYQTSKPSNITVVHESEILSLAGVNIIRDANDWT